MNQDIHIFDCSEGDFNDCFSRFYLKGTVEQVDKYLKDMIINTGYDEKDIEDINADPWGYGITNDNGDYEYFVDASQLEETQDQILEGYTIEEFNKKFFYHKFHDLTIEEDLTN